MLKREFSAGGVVVYIEKGTPQILLIKDSYGKWTWPKGKISKNEYAKDAAIREVQEETGIKDVEVLAEVDTIKYFYRLHGSTIFKKVYIFLIKAKNKGDVKIQEDEIQDAQWFNADEALKVLSYRGSDKILKKALKVFKQVQQSKGRNQC